MWYQTAFAGIALDYWWWAWSATGRRLLVQTERVLSLMMVAYIISM